MKPFILKGLLITGLFFLVGAAQTSVHRIDWSKMKAAGTQLPGTLASGETPDKLEALRIENTTNQPVTIKLATLEAPKLSQSKWRLTGRIRYQNVEGAGYLELWNHFNQGSYFTRSLADSGPMGKISGSSEWRDFVLPFDASTGNAQLKLTRLELNLVLPGKGVVFIGPVELHEGFGSAGWWNDPSGAWLGAILGVSLGCVGAMVGILSSLGKARQLVLWLCQGGFVVGIVLLVAGLAALATGQPYGIYYPLLLCGTISGLVFGLNYRTLFRRYQELELRQMQARDAML
ncbi:MAG: hypothetical protein HY774_08955 [Acidobacteria bacterium]|nr:hypothetical protein [Acidobacteriota bacterium]